MNNSSEENMYLILLIKDGVQSIIKHSEENPWESGGVTAGESVQCLLDLVKSNEGRQKALPTVSAQYLLAFHFELYLNYMIFIH